MISLINLFTHELANLYKTVRRAISRRSHEKIGDCEQCKGTDGNIATTPFSVHYEEMRNHLFETATNSAKIHSLVRKYEHLRLNQIQLRFLQFNQHSITLLGTHMRHSAYKREKYAYRNMFTEQSNVHHLPWGNNS